MTNTKEILYPVVLHKDENSCWGATVPDLQGCFGAGEYASDAVASAREASIYHLKSFVSTGESIPEPSDINKLMGSGEYDSGLWAILEINVNDFVMGWGCD